MLSECAPLKYRDYCMLVDKADNASSAERSFEKLNEQGNSIKVEGNVDEAGSYQTRTLTSIFSMVTKTEKLYGQSVGIYKNVVAEVKENNNKSTTDINSKHIAAFERQFSKINATDKYKFICEVDKLLRKYLWCIPSDSYNKVVTDISLYDHLKTTAMIADVMFRQGKTKHNSFSLVYIKMVRPHKYILSNGSSRGENGEIRETVFDRIGNLQEFKKKTIKSLLDIDGVESTPCNLIYNRYYDVLLFINNSDDIRQKISEINNELIRYTNMETYLCMAYINIDDIKLNSTYRYIRDLKESAELESAVSRDITVIGLNEILTSRSGGWLAEKDFETFKLAPNSTDIEKLHKVYAMIRIDFNNINDILESMFTIDSDTINRWNKNGGILTEGIELGLGTVSRVATIFRTLNNLSKTQTWFGGSTLSKSDNSVVFITEASTIGGKVEDYLSNIRAATIDTIKPDIYIRTFRMSDSIWKVYTELMSIHKKGEHLSNYIYYNGIYVSKAELFKLDNIFAMVKRSYKINTSAIYRIQGYITEIKRYILNKQGIPMCISRFNYRLNNKTLKDGLDEEFSRYLTEQFNTVLSKGKNNLFLALDTVIKDVSIEERNVE